MPPFTSPDVQRCTRQSTTPQFLPVGGSFDNFAAVLSDGAFVQALGVSLAVTLATVGICLIVAFLGALAISRFRFRGRKSFILALLLIQMLPAEGMFIAQYKMMSSVNMLNSVLGLTVLYAAAVVPFTIWMLRGFVAGVPVELEEAAMVDGLSRTKAFLRITFPLLAPRPGRLRRLRLPAGLERIHRGAGGHDRRPGQDAAAVAAFIHPGFGHP